MATITETELQKRLRKLESAALDPSDTVVLTDDQYTLSENVIYVAYASALSNLVNGTIPNQSDATDFQYSPYNAAGVLMAYRGYFSSTSIYASGDPTDYTWESTSGLTGFTSSERYYTTSTGLLSALGNPTEPGSGITWTIIASGNAIPGTAVWYAERFTVSGITSGWTITAVGAYVNSSILQDDSVTTAKIVDNAITATEIADNTISTGQIATNAITSNEIAANAITASELAAGAISAGSITATEIATNAITADKVASNAITSVKVNADAITVDKIDLDGTLSVTADSGAIRWGKTDGDDVDNSGLFIGRNSSGSPRFVIGSPSSFIYYNGTTGVVSAIGVSSSATTGEEENFFTDTSSTHTLNLSPLVDEINIQMVGAGGGGGRNGTSDGSTPTSTSGGASIVKVVQSNGTVRATYTANGGAYGNPRSGGGGGGSFAAGQNGGSFAHPGGSNHSSFVGTGGAGGAYNTNNAGGDGGTGSGGGGQGQAGGGSAADGGAGGAAGTFYTTTLLKSSGDYVSTDHLEITVGLAGVGQHHQSGNTPNVKAGGHGGAGRVRIKGEDT